MQRYSQLGSDTQTTNSPDSSFSPSLFSTPSYSPANNPSINNSPLSAAKKLFPIKLPSINLGQPSTKSQFSTPTQSPASHSFVNNSPLSDAKKLTKLPSLNLGQPSTKSQFSTPTQSPASHSFVNNSPLSDAKKITKLPSLNLGQQATKSKSQFSTPNQSPANRLFQPILPPLNLCTSPTQLPEENPKISHKKNQNELKVEVNSLGIFHAPKSGQILEAINPVCDDILEQKTTHFFYKKIALLRLYENYNLQKEIYDRVCHAFPQNGNKVKSLEIKKELEMLSNIHSRITSYQREIQLLEQELSPPQQKPPGRLTF